MYAVLLQEKQHSHVFMGHSLGTLGPGFNEEEDCGALVLALIDGRREMCLFSLQGLTCLFHVPSSESSHLVLDCN